MRMLAPSVTSNCQLLFVVFAVFLLQDRLSAVSAKQIHAPPVIADGLLREIGFKEREPVELPCVASGDPPPAYSWKKDGEPLNVISGIDIRQLPGVGTIQIEDPTAAAHEGIYQCFASNEFGTAISVKTTLKKAVQEPFPSTREPKIHRPYVGHALTLRCQPPYGYPKGVVYWGEFDKRRSKLKPIENSERVSLDYEGNLHFSNIEMTDDRGEFHYVCIVQNMELRSLMQGDDQKISPMAAQPRYEKPRMMWASPAKIEVAIKGQTKKLKCIFGGYPTPRVTWTRVDRPLVETPGRIQRSSFGQELVFTDVDFSDEGTYECSAVNTESGQPKATHRTQLVVGSPPYWKDDCPPENVNTSEEESAQFNCEAEGVPQPTISWFINGVPLSELPSNRRRIVANDNRYIRYENVTKTDAQVLQCNASNEHGYIFSNAYLNVLGSDDEWTSVGPENENNWLNVSNLESETEYNFRVVAMNNGENKTTSGPAVILIVILSQLQWRRVLPAPGGLLHCCVFFYSFSSS